MTKQAAATATILATLTLFTSGCAVVAVTDAAVSVAATAVKVGANVVGAVSDVARAGVRAATNNTDQKK